MCVFYIKSQLYKSSLGPRAHVMPRDTMAAGTHWASKSGNERVFVASVLSAPASEGRENPDTTKTQRLAAKPTSRTTRTDPNRPHGFRINQAPGPGTQSFLGGGGGGNPSSAAMRPRDRRPRCLVSAQPRSFQKPSLLGFLPGNAPVQSETPQTRQEA